MATATTAPSGILTNLDLKNFDLEDLAKIAKLIGKRTALGSLFVPTTMGDATLDNYTPEQIAAMIKTPAGDVYAPSEEEIRKRQEEDAERAKNTGLTPIPENEKITGNVTTIPNIDELTSKPLITPIPEKIDTGSVTPFPEEKSFEDYIITMANPKFDKEGNRIYRINNKTYTEDELNFEGDGRTYRDIESVKTEAKTYLSKEQFKTGFEEFLNNNPDFMKKYNAKRNERGFMQDQAEEINKYLEKSLPADSIQRLIRQSYGKKELKEGRDKLPTQLATVFDTGVGQIGSDIARSMDRTEIQNIEEALTFFKSQKIDPKLETKSFMSLEGPQEAMKYLDTAKDKLLEVIKNDEVQQSLKAELGDNFIPFKFDKSHPDRTLVPSDEASQFSGTDTYDLKILESQVNYVLQPDLEKALARHIKDKNVDGAKNIIEMMEEYSIGTRMNTPFKKEQITLEDKKWAEKNNLITVPMIEEKGEASNIKNYDNVVFGTLAQPSPEKIINDGIKVRKDYLPAKKRYQESEPKEAFHTKLKDGGMMNINDITRPLGNF